MNNSNGKFMVTTVQHNLNLTSTRVRKLHDSTRFSDYSMRACMFTQEQ